jgi:hypothetical protein
MAGTIDHAERAHSRIGPSQAERVWHCAASVQMTEKHGVAREAGAAALAGTKAHEMAERALRKQGPVEGDDDLADAARLFVLTVEADVAASGPDHVLLVEEQVGLERHHPELTGTMDAALLDPGRRRLYLYDLKTGRVPVEADVLQLQLYAAMVLEKLGERAADVDTVETVIVQPYARHADGTVRRARHMRADIIATAQEYVTRAWVATGSNDMPEATAGVWCKYCPARGACLAFRDYQTEKAKLEFAPTGQLLKMLPPANDIPLEHIGYLLTAAAMLKPWIAAVEERGLYVMETLKVPIDGWSLRDKRATRRWTDPGRAEKRLRAMGLPSNKLYKQEFITPAQAEKILALQDRGAIQDLIIAESSGKTLVAQPFLSESVNIDNLEN